MNILELNKVETLKKYLKLIQYMLILIIACLLPYWRFYSEIQDFSIYLFIITLLLNEFKVKELLYNKVFLLLSSFIIFTYLSILWSAAGTINNTEYFFNVLRFKYYFLIIPCIYFSSLSTAQVKTVFFVSALAPIGIVFLYYSNAFGFTQIYSFMIGGTSYFFMHYLICNFFLMYSSIYFSISSIHAFQNKDYKRLSLFLFLTLFFLSSMVIDPKTTSRLTIIVYLITLLYIPLLYFKRRNAILLTLVILIISSIFVISNKRIHDGYDKAVLAIETDTYTSSWGHRVGFAIVGLKIFLERPIIGRGIGDVTNRTIAFAKENPKYFRGDPNRHFHNEHINILVQVGIFGYSIFIVFIFFLIRVSIKNIFYNNIKYLFTLAFILMMMGEHYLSILNTSSYFSFFVGLILLCKKLENTKSQTNN